MNIADGFADAWSRLVNVADGVADAWSSGTSALRLATSRHKLMSTAIWIEELLVLCGLPPQARETGARRRGDADLLNLLESVRDRLERFHAAAPRLPPMYPATHGALNERPLPGSPGGDEPGTESLALRDLIAVRDMVAAAAAQQPEAAREVLDAVDRKLGAVLEKSGVEILEDAGFFNDRSQEILGFRTTEDPHQEEMICETLRPGYVIEGRVMRPQQVVVYRLDG